ncbi:MAG: ferrochelatase [Bacteroidia bacterium]|nr:ferrochelatase [Bacteroidia bacterium]
MKKGVLLVNIGSPDSFNTVAVRQYLRNFLMDKRVIDIPFLFRFLLVNMIIAPFRASKSLRAYNEILIQNQSPLLYYSKLLENALQVKLGKNYMVKIAMMYGKPYLKDILREFKKIHLSEIIIIPLYPQYASSTTGSALESVFDELKNWPIIPNIKTIHTFYNDTEFVTIWANHIKKHLPENYDFVLFSYHGLPIRQIFKADKQFVQQHCNLDSCCHSIYEKNEFCYRSNCINTTKWITEKLSLDTDKIGTCFQSRLGQSEWLKPYASDYLKELCTKGVKNLVVVSPAFVTDCLETLYEIEKEYSALFMQYGGEKLTLIPSLNAEEEWVRFLCRKITE